MANNVKFGRGSKTNWTALTRDIDTIYFVSDSNTTGEYDTVYLGEKLVASSKINLLKTVTGTTNDAKGSLYYASGNGAVTKLAPSLPSSGNFKFLKLASDGSLSWAASSEILPNSGVTAGTYSNQTGSTLTYGGTFKVPKLVVNAQGIITGASDEQFTMPIAKNIVGASSSAYANAAATNGNVYLNLISKEASGGAQSSINIIGDNALQSGAGSMKVTSDASGKITVSCEWNDLA